jgi:hypothetical protein
MAQRAGAQRAWWADVEEVRERIERRQAFENERARSERRPTGRRTVSITGRPDGPSAPLRLVERIPIDAPGVPVRSRRRPAPRVVDRIASRPDRIAGWAVLLGFALVVVTILTAHS